MLTVNIFTIFIIYFNINLFVPTTFLLFLFMRKNDAQFFLKNIIVINCKNIKFMVTNKLDSKLKIFFVIW